VFPVLVLVYCIVTSIYIRVCNFHGMSLRFNQLNMSGGILRITRFELSVMY
jgi:hypothetical protein